MLYHCRRDLQEKTITKELDMYTNPLLDCMDTLLLRPTIQNMFSLKNMEGDIVLTWTTTRLVLFHPEVITATDSR